MRGSLLQCSYVSLGSETSQTALAASREKYHRAKSQVCAKRRPSAPSIAHDASAFRSAAPPRFREFRGRRKVLECRREQGTASAERLMELQSRAKSRVAPSSELRAFLLRDGQFSADTECETCYRGHIGIKLAQQAVNRQRSCASSSWGDGFGRAAWTFPISIFTVSITC